MNVGVGVMYSWFYNVSDLSVKHLIRMTGKTDPIDDAEMNEEESPLREGNLPLKISSSGY